MTGLGKALLPFRLNTPRRGYGGPRTPAPIYRWHMWTNDQIIAEFKRIEALANKTQRGADHSQILDIVTAKSGRPLSDVRRVILDSTFSKPN